MTIVVAPDRFPIWGECKGSELFTECKACLGRQIDYDAPEAGRTLAIGRRNHGAKGNGRPALDGGQYDPAVCGFQFTTFKLKTIVDPLRIRWIKLLSQEALPCGATGHDRPEPESRFNRLPSSPGK